MDEDPAVTRFREYLRIKTVHPNPDYASAVAFIKAQAEDVGLEFKVIEPHPGRAIVLLTLMGDEPKLPSILLNSHTDVVPVNLDNWKYDPFEAVKDDTGKIFARGSQDMKCVGVQYLEAIRRLKLGGVKLRRTVHLSFVPDEEIGGHLGMKKFVTMPEFKELNVGFALDEGLANPSDAFTVFFGERFIWWLKVTCCGSTGHGSRFIENTAAEKLQKVINSFMEFREHEQQIFNSNYGEYTLGDVTTVNMTQVEGGVQPNVVPMKMSAVFDIRIPPATNTEDLENMIKNWTESAGNDVTYEFLQKSGTAGITSVKESDPWWTAFRVACEEMDLDIDLEIFPAATDSRFLRELGYPALGFSPINNTPILLHDDNEFLHEDCFLNGIEIYCKIIPALANVTPL